MVSKLNTAEPVGVNISFPELPATVRDILMVLNKITEQKAMPSVACKNGSSACLHFLNMSPDPYFYFISGLYLSKHLK